MHVLQTIVKSSLPFCVYIGISSSDVTKKCFCYAREGKRESKRGGEREGEREKNSRYKGLTRYFDIVPS